MEKATRQAGTTASVEAAIREARERAEEAWKVLDFPDRMQIATDAAQAAIRRADGFVAGGTATDEVLAELAAARKDVDDLARHTQLVRTCIANQHRFADDVSTDVMQALRDLCARQLDALRRFGLDPLATSPDAIAAVVAPSPIRDLILGALLEVHEHTVEFADEEPSSSAVHDAKVLDEVIRVCRRRCGGAYARWQDLLDRKDVPGLLAFADSPDAMSFRSMLVGALGRDLDHTKDYQACLAFRRKAADRFPHDVFAQYDLHTTCRQVKPYETLEALQHISAAAALRPDSPLFHLQLGACYGALRATDRAVDCFRKALALRPDYAIAYGYIGNALYDKKEFDQSLAAYRDAVRVNPKSIAWRSVLAMRLEGLGRSKEAAAVYQEMLPLATEQLEKSRKRLGRDHLGTRQLLYYVVVPLVKLGRIEEAMPSLEDFIRHGGAFGRPEGVQESVAAALAYFRARHDAMSCRRLAERWEQANTTNGGWLYDAACWRAITAATIKESGAPDAAKQAVAEADRAVDWLRKAIANGYKDVANMKKDSDLDSLRGREDFKKLLTDLEAREQGAKK